jgi:hypothetical protein
VNRFRVTTAVLICASLLALTACAGEDPPATSAGSIPGAAATPSAAIATSAPPAAAGGTSDKELCESAKKAGEDMKDELISALQAGGEPSPALFKEILTTMNEKMTTLSAEGDSEVANAMKEFGGEAAQAAKAADPAGAADNSAFEKAGADVTAACKPVGVDVNF